MYTCVYIYIYRERERGLVELTLRQLQLLGVLREGLLLVGLRSGLVAGLVLLQGLVLLRLEHVLLVLVGLGIIIISITMIIVIIISSSSSTLISLVVYLYIYLYY